MCRQDIVLRPHRADDIDALRLIERDAHRRYAGIDGLRNIVDRPAIAPERFLTGETTVAEIGGKRVGYVLAHPLDGLMYIASIMVEQNASGLGIGAALIRHVERRAMELALPGVALTTFKLPPWNGPWFRRHGFAPIPASAVGSGLQAILDRHATFLDMTTRETLRKEVAAQVWQTAET